MVGGELRQGLDRHHGFVKPAAAEDQGDEGTLVLARNTFNNCDGLRIPVKFLALIVSPCLR